MKFLFNHQNFNVLDLEKSIAFYEEALGLTVNRTYKASDGSFILTYMGDMATGFQLELTWLRDRKEAYNLGDNEFHLAFEVDNMQEAYQKHKAMGCADRSARKISRPRKRRPYVLLRFPPSRRRHCEACR